MIKGGIIHDSSHEIYTVSKLNAKASDLIAKHIGFVGVIGEIANLSHPPSGHLYFTLKDEQAQIRCAWFRPYQKCLDFSLGDGQQVLAYGKTSFYQRRGDFQLIVEHLEDAGEGLLKQQLEKLKKQLAAEGLLDAQIKKLIPRSPQTIGIITSPTGAAIQDILQILKRRSPSTRVVIYPSLVQGKEAAYQITKMIQLANQRLECDVLLLTRGGGPLEDLWCFNEKSVAYALHNSKLPTLSAIGHEMDITLSDLVADMRAPTPSAAAELLSFEKTTIKEQLKHYQKRLIQAIRYSLQQKFQRLEQLEKRLINPKKKLTEQIQHLDYLLLGLKKAMQRLLDKKQSQLNQWTHMLHILNPLNVLARGYAIIRKPNQQPIHSATQLKRKEQALVQFKDGELVVQVVKMSPTRIK